MALTHLLSGIDLSFQQAAETSGGSGSYFSTLGTKNPRAGRGGRRVCVCREQQKNRASEGPTAPPPRLCDHRPVLFPLWAPLFIFKMKRLD